MEESNPLKLELDQNEIENTQIMKLKEIIRNIFRILRVMSGKNRFLLGFVVVVLILALIRVANPSVAESRLTKAEAADSLKMILLLCWPRMMRHGRWKIHHLMPPSQMVPLPTNWRMPE